MYLTDSHIHTKFSSDSDASMESMVLQAIRLNVKEITITDHIDLEYPDENYPFSIDYPIYKKAIEACREAYGDKIKIHLGVEIGLQPHLKKELEKITASNQYDFIIGSSHTVGKKELYGNDFYKGKQKKEAYTQYFEEVLYNIKHIPIFQVYGHLDYVNRYGDYADNSLSPHTYREIIEEILKALIASGKGIEVNTSGYKYGLGHTHPQPEILKWYKALGGKLLTIGSDAHSPQEICGYFKEATAVIEACGFSSIAVFENQQPVFHSIK